MPSRCSGASGRRPGGGLRAGELQENVLQIGLLGGEVDDGEARGLYGREEIGKPRPAGPVAEDETGGRGDLDVEPLQRLAQLAQALRKCYGERLGVEPARQILGALCD